MIECASQVYNQDIKFKLNYSLVKFTIKMLKNM